MSNIEMFDNPKNNGFIQKQGTVHNKINTNSTHENYRATVELQLSSVTMFHRKHPLIGPLWVCFPTASQVKMLSL